MQYASISREQGHVKVNGQNRKKAEHGVQGNASCIAI
jgi:hypothetical protein